MREVKEIVDIMQRELQDKIATLESKLETVVDQIFTAKDLGELKELTKRNFPDEWKEYDFCTEKQPSDKYDPEYGDNRLCECGHPYHRHFDSGEDVAAVGCKYCGCKFQDKGGWIEWKGGKQPVADEVTVDIKYNNGKFFRTKADYTSLWEWDNEYENGNWNVVAYRIIDDPKKEKPKKQTLFEWAHKDLESRSPGHQAITSKYGGLLDFISEYLEQNG
jgi:hypothetical protein